MTAKTNLAVGDKIWFETGGTGSTVGGVANSLTQAYITSISSTDNNITVSEDVQVIASGLAVTGWLSDKSTGLLPAADSDTNKVGKDFSIAVKTEETTAQVVLWISNKSVTTNVIELFFDGILVSQNKFLQASSQTKSEGYYTTQFAGFWQATGTTFLFNTTNLASGGNTPPLASSRLISISDVSSKTRITAKQDIVLDVTVTNNNAASNATEIFNSDDQAISMFFSTSAHWGNVSASVSLKKDDYVYLKAGSNNSAEGGLNLTATPETSDVILLESQDEIFEDWTEFTPSIGGSTTSNIKFHYRRTGSNMDIRGTYFIDTIGTGTDAAPGSFTLPTGFKLDTTQLESQKSVLGRGFYIDSGGFYVTENARGWVMTYYAGGTSPAGDSAVYFAARSSTSSQLEIDNLSGILGDNNRQFSLFCSVPVQGYNVNFNPLLSMPLVEIGSDCEYYNYRFLTNPVNTGTNKSYRLLANTSTGSEIDNTISSLGTIDNSTTEGWSFQASQRVKVHFAVGFACSTTSAGVGIVKLPNAPSTYANEAWGHSQWDDLGVGGTQDTRTGAGYQGATSVSIIMEPGEYIQAIVDNTNIQNSAKSGFTLLVERDRSNTNMAHIIKPSVARITYETERNANSGGSTGAGAGFVVRPLTNLTGEAYFVTIDTSTDTFTLDPGTYQIRWKAYGFSTEAFQTRLELDSALYKYGSLGYSVSTGMANDISYGDVVTTVTSSTQTWRLTHIQSHNNTTNGFGKSQNGWDAPQIHSEIVIEKLK